MSSPDRIVLPRSGLEVSIRKVIGGWEINLLNYDGSEHRFLCGKRDRSDAIRSSDARVLALRSALLAGAEETVARTCFEWDRGATWEERTNSDVENYMDQARAVLAALRGEESK